MNNPHAINVYTDGSVASNLRSSGQGIVICYPDGDEREILNFGFRNSTISRRELSACVEALKSLYTDPKGKGISQICIHSDSQYVVNNYKHAYGKWPDNGWKTSDGNDVDNIDLWKDLIREMKKSGKRVEIFKVKAHSKNKYNKRADDLATKSREMPFNTDFKGERKQIRRWLPIDEIKINVSVKSQLIVFVQRTDPREKLFEAHVQILRPKKYRGVRIKIRGNLNKHSLRGAHLYKVKLIDQKNVLVIDKFTDLGKSSENKKLLV